MGSYTRAGVLIASALFFSACATHKASHSGSLFIRDGKPKMDLPAEVLRQGGGDSLETVIAKTRELTARAKPPLRTPPATIETVDRRLAAALRQLLTDPSVENHLAVADAYRTAGILDQAYDHYAAARALDPGRAAAYDGMARIWRDWRLPGFALGDAYRAVHYAPRSPEAWNTLGTILQALDNKRAAEAAYARALAVDPLATYALNNWCRAAESVGDRPAVTSCARAAVVRQAIAGNVAASTQYRNGLQFLAYGAFALAAESFDNAVRVSAASAETDVTQKGGQ